MDDVERFVIDGNISRFVDQLRGERDPSRQQVLKRLLIAEESRFAATLDRLQMVERYLTEGEERIANQRRLVAAMRNNGGDAGAAERTLRAFESIQDIFQTAHASVHEALERRRP